MPRRGENIYRRKDGRYEGRYVVGRAPNGRTRFGYVYGRQYGAVREELARRRSQQSAGGETAAGRTTLAACMVRWLEEVRGSVKQSSYQTYRSLAEKHILPALGRTPISRITAGGVRDFSVQLAAKGLADGTVRSACRLISACLRYAQEEGMIAKNPCRRMKISVEQPQMQRVLTGRELETVGKSAMDAGELPVLLAMYTGMRLGEICGLKWTDVDWARGTLCVCRTVQRIRKTGGGTILAVDTPKSLKSRRVLPVPAFIMELLKKRRAGSPSGFVFGAEMRPAEPRTVQRRFRTLLKRTGISGAHFHTLRHSFATRLIEMGVDIKTVSALLGHSSAKTTLDFYVHSRMETRRAAVERLAAM